MNTIEKFEAQLRDLRMVVNMAGGKRQTIKMKCFRNTMKLVEDKINACLLYNRAAAAMVKSGTNKEDIKDITSFLIPMFQEIIDYWREVVRE